MSVRVVFSPEALADLAALYDYIAPRGGEAVAAAFVRRIVDYCEGLEAFPARGTRRDDIWPGLRLVGYRRQATIALEVTAEEARIVRVLARGLDVEAVLRGEEE